MSLLMAGKCYRAGQGRRLKQSISLGVVVYPRVVANGVGHATTPCTPINSSILDCRSHNAGSQALSIVAGSTSAELRRHVPIYRKYHDIISLLLFNPFLFFPLRKLDLNF